MYRTLNLKITTDDNWDFFSYYDSLGEGQKKIFKYIQEFARSKPNVFPSQERIAKACGCTRKHVNRTLAKFKRLGWLSLIYRGIRKTKRIIMQPIHQAIDLMKRNFFKKIEVTSGVTHTYSYSQSKTGGRAGEELETLTIKEHLHKYPLSLEQKLKLSLVSEEVFKIGLEKAKKKDTTGWNNERLAKYLTGTVLKAAKEMGCKIEWRRYYATLKGR